MDGVLTDLHREMTKRTKARREPCAPSSRGTPACDSWNPCVRFRRMPAPFQGMPRNRIQNLVAPVAVLAVTLMLASCSSSDESNLDVLAEWRKNAPTTSAPEASSAGSTIDLPSLPEGADPLAPENYRVAAIRSYGTVRGYIMALIELTGEFDLGSEAWATGLRELSAKFKDEVAYFETLNPPAEYVEQHDTLVSSMAKLDVHVDDLGVALSVGNFADGAEALNAMQDESNTLVKNGRFGDLEGFTTTTVPVP